ncbi:MAG: S8 family serine peptidase [Acidobacteria bacterium]|nr:S8 family serine peptidase [Acidobacteriota bacterium]
MFAHATSIWNRFKSLMLLPLLLTLPGAAQITPPAAPNRVLVKFRTGAAAQIPQVERDEDIAEARPVGSTGALLMQSRSKDTQTLVRNLRNRPEVEYAEPDYIVSAIGATNDPYYSQLWGMAKISAPAAWDTWTGKSTVAVGVVDTGVDYTHPDLFANIWSSTNGYTVTVGGKQMTCPAGSHGFRSSLAGRKLSCDPMDDNNHGTHVSGTIGAVGNNALGVVGVNWTTAIVGLKFLDSNGRGYTSDAINVIDVAVQLKQQGVNIRVLSNSWGGGSFSQTLENEIAKAGTADMLFVAAAGNNGYNNDTLPSYPASYPNANIIAVAATDSNDALASFSNYGALSVDLAAPGVNIYSTLPKATYGAYSGTSMATPHVSGAAALVLSACGTVGTAALKTAILTNVVPVGGLIGKVQTGGRLNVLNAVTGVPACSTPADFTITAAPSSQTVAPGTSANYSVTVSPTSGFSGNVTLTASNLPAGATASFSPNPVLGGSGASAMTVTTSGVAAGTYTLMITGTSGSLTHSANVTLVVASPSPSPSDFAISASPAARSIPAGKQTTYTVTVTPSGGFTGTVALSATGP